MGLAQEAVRRIEREAHSLPPPSGKLLQFGHPELKRHLENFLKLAYELEPEGLNHDGLERIERCFDLMILCVSWLVQAEEWQAHRSYYESQLNRLRESLDLVSRGLSADPSKAPAPEEEQRLAQECAAKALSALFESR